MNKKILPPRTILRLTRLWPNARKQGKEKGQIYRVGYYCRDCGTDVIWLVNTAGEYKWTVELPFVEKHFEILELSKERSKFGKGKPKIEPYQPEDAKSK